MRYLSVCSGIEAASEAWQPRGWEPVAFSEIDPMACAVLQARHPSVPNWGDMTKFEEWPDAAVDVLCGGTPCQSFSVAGLRQGLADPRGNLMLTFGAVARRYRPEWLVWENVPGVLSSGRGRDFGSFLGMLGELGYGIAYRVLDAQYVRTCRFPLAVPQRRRRVWVVGYLGDWRRAAAVLFDRESLSGHPAPRRQAGPGFASDVAPSLTGSSVGVRRVGESRGQDPVIAVGGGPDGGRIAGTITSKWEKGSGGPAGDETMNLVAHTLRGEGHDATEDGSGRVTLQPVRGPTVAFGANDHGHDALEDVSPTLRAGGSNESRANGGVPPAIAFDLRGREGGAALEGPYDTAAVRAASGGSSRSYVADRWQVRRLTPLECERLQGFPDGHTEVSVRRRNSVPDGPRYRVIGNSWPVNCADWIGERIDIVAKWETADG